MNTTHTDSIVAADKLPARIRNELKALAQNRVPAVPGLDLPEDFLLVTEWERNGDRIRIEATKGPVPHVPPGFVRLACGTRYSIVLMRANGCRGVERSTISEC
jgi:hypothetical protein